MHLRHINLVVKLFLATLISSIVTFIPSTVKSQALNLSGIVELDYNSTVTDIKISGEKAKSKTSDFMQRYGISGSGIIVDPRLASYSASIGITNSIYRNKPAGEESTKIGRDTLTYSLQISLFPTRSPINLFAQRNVINVENAPDITNETYSLGWYTTLRTQTTLRITLLQIGSKYEDPTNPRDTRIRIGNLGLTQTFRTGSLSGNLQYTDYLVETEGRPTESSKVSSYSIRGETRLRPTLFLSGNITYFPKGSVFAPGITTTTETTGEIGLLHQVERFSQRVDYAFRKTASGEVERDAISYNINYRPLGKTDYTGDAIYTTTKSQQVDTMEYRAAAGVHHRPFYGLTITTNIVLHHFDVSGIAESRTDRIGTMAGVSYFTLFESFNLNTGYTADYSVVLSDQEEAEGSIITHTGSLGLQTRTLKTAQIMGSYSFLLRENNIVPTDDRQEQTVRIEATSTYFRRWLLRASTSLSNVVDYGDTLLFDSRAEYFLMAGTSFAGGYRYSNYPSATNSQDSQLYFLEGQHYRYLTRRLSLNLNTRGEREELRYTDRNRLTFTSTFNYQIGKINVNFEFREDYTKYPESVYNIHSYFIRASRPF